MTARAPLIILATYVVGFVIFWPVAAVIADEAFYVRAAEAFAHGRTTVDTFDPLTDHVARERPSYFAAGTSLLQAPFVRFAGFRGAPLVSLLCYCLTGLLLSRWLVREGHSASFSLLFLGFAPALILARTAMSDLPSALAVCATQMLIFAGGPRSDRPRPRIGDLAAGVLAGLSILVRETNVIFVTPFLVGAILRREGRTRGLLGGLILGVAIAALVSFVVFGTPLYIRPHREWSVTTLIERLPVNAAVLLVFAPLGLWAALSYRGQRRPEVIVTTVVALAFFSAYDYTGAPSGGMKQVILSTRYFIPLIPLLGIALAEAGPRLVRALKSPRLLRVYRVAPISIVFVTAFAVHPTLGWVGLQERAIGDALRENTTAQGVLVLSRVELDKYVIEWNGNRKIANFRNLAPASLPSLVARDGVTFVALLDRNESDFHRALADEQDRWRLEAARYCTLDATYDAVHAGKRLRIFKVVTCRDA